MTSVFFSQTPALFVPSSGFGGPKIRCLLCVTVQRTVMGRTGLIVSSCGPPLTHTALATSL